MTWDEDDYYDYDELENELNERQERIDELEYRNKKMEEEEKRSEEERKRREWSDIYAPTIDPGYRPWDVEWRDKHLYNAIPKDWGEMTPSERIQRLEDEKRTSDLLSKFGGLGGSNIPNYSETFKPTRMSSNKIMSPTSNSPSRNIGDWVIVTLIILGIICMVLTFTLGI